MYKRAGVLDRNYLRYDGILHSILNTSKEILEGWANSREDKERTAFE